MKIARVLFAVLAVAALGTLVSCDLFDNPTMIIGSINVSTYNPVAEGTTYHIVLYSATTTMDPTVDYATAERAEEVAGTFPDADVGVTFDTINYTLSDVPAGVYSMFVWVDSDDSGEFESGQDLYGFYYGDPSAYNLEQPPANVVVPAEGVVDVDIWLDNYPR
jgi:hypothetical protein